MVELTTGKIAAPVKCVVYGAEGIGKSTLASKMPGAVFLDLEKGTSRIDVKRVDKRYQNIDQIITDMADLAAHKAEYGLQTLVIDTIDALEMVIIKQICKKFNKDGIESFGYGKGYTYVGEEMKRFLEACDGVIAQGVNVTLLAHAKITKFEQPDELGAYDRWSMKLTKMSAPLVKEWADALLFCNYKTTVVKSSDNKKKAMGGERTMYSTHHSCWDAKNRFDLPDEMKLDFSEIARIYEGNTAIDPKEKIDAIPFDTGIASETATEESNVALPFDLGSPPPDEVESAEVRGLRSLMKMDNITEDQVLSAFDGKYSAIENIEPEVIQTKLLNKWQSFIKYVTGGSAK